MQGGQSEKQEKGGAIEELTIAEIFQKYHGRWVAVIVTRRDENLQPAAGRVIAEDVDRYRLRQTTSKVREEICIFFAGEPEFPILL